MDKDFDAKSISSSHDQNPSNALVGDSLFLISDSDASQMSKPSYLQYKFKQVADNFLDANRYKHDTFMHTYL